MILAAEVSWTMWLVWPGIFMLCESLDMLFCGMEQGVYSINKIRLDLKDEEGSRPARTLSRMLAGPNNMLAVLLIGTNLCRYLATFCVTSLFAMGGSADPELYTTLVTTPLLFVMADAVPKHVFRRRAETWTYRFSGLLKWANRVFLFTGLSLVVRGFSAALIRLTPAGRRKEGPMGAERMAAILAEGQASGVLTTFQSRMAHRVMNIYDVRLADAMNPMSRVVSLPADATADQARDVACAHEYSRVPMLADDGKVVGTLSLFDVLVEPGLARPADVMLDPLVLAADLPVNEALYRMQRRRAAMAVVRDGRSGRHVGIVTVKDLVEEIVGELGAW